MSPLRRRMYAIVRRIPRGRVMTYGQLARRAGLTNGARQAGYAMAAAPAGIPWQRVVAVGRAGRARLSIRDSLTRDLQRSLLEAEGVAFDARGEIELASFGVRGR